MPLSYAIVYHCAVYSFPEKFCTTFSSARMGQNFSGDLYYVHDRIGLVAIRLVGRLAGLPMMQQPCPPTL